MLGIKPFLYNIIFYNYEICPIYRFKFEGNGGLIDTGWSDYDTAVDFYSGLKCIYSEEQFIISGEKDISFSNIRDALEHIEKILSY